MVGKGRDSSLSCLDYAMECACVKGAALTPFVLNGADPSYPVGTSHTSLAKLITKCVNLFFSFCRRCTEPPPTCCHGNGSDLPNTSFTHYLYKGALLGEQGVRCR